MSSLRYDDRIGRIKPLGQRFCRACGKYTRSYKHRTATGEWPPKTAERCACDGRYVPGGPRYCSICGNRMNKHETACGDFAEFQMQDGEAFSADLEAQPGPDDPTWRR